MVSAVCEGCGDQVCEAAKLLPLVAFYSRNIVAILYLCYLLELSSL